MKAQVLFICALAVTHSNALLNGAVVSQASLAANVDGCASVCTGYANNNNGNCLGIMMSSTKVLIPAGSCGDVYNTQPGIVTIDPISSDLEYIPYLSIVNTSVPGFQMLTLNGTNNVGTPPLVAHDPLMKNTPTLGTRCHVFGFNTVIDDQNDETFILTEIDTNVISITDCVNAWAGIVNVKTDGSQFCAYVTTDGTPTGANAIHSAQQYPFAVSEYPAPVFCRNSGNIRPYDRNPVLPPGTDVGLALKLALVNGEVIGMSGSNVNLQQTGTYMFAGFAANATVVNDTAIRPAIYQYAFDVTELS